VACGANAEIAETLDFSQYMSMGHVAAQFGKSRKPAIEEWLLLQHGLKRRVEVAAQAFATIPHLVLGTNLIATMHSRLARHFARTLPLRVLPLPLPLPAFVEALQWSPASDADPASVWMRNLILEEAEAARGNVSFRETTNCRGMTLMGAKLPNANAEVWPG
jgi:LysR family nod box-dependent transcriptional activator